MRTISAGNVYDSSRYTNNYATGLFYVKFFLRRELRAKRKRRKMLQEQQKSKDGTENTKFQDKTLSETDEDSKDTVSVIEDETQADIAESKVKY